MADPSFDVVSKVDRQEVDNALNQAAKELVPALRLPRHRHRIAWAGEEAVTIESETEERAAAAVEVFKEKLIKRSISLKAFDVGRADDLRQDVQGHRQDPAGHRVGQGQGDRQAIRDEKLKGVQAQIQGDQLRVSGKKKDDLQARHRAAQGQGLRDRAAVHQLPVIRRRPSLLTSWNGRPAGANVGHNSRRHSTRRIRQQRGVDEARVRSIWSGHSLP